MKPQKLKMVYFILALIFSFTGGVFLGRSEWIFALGCFAISAIFLIKKWSINATPI